MTVVISGWSAISAYGVGRTAFAEGVLAGRQAISDVGQEASPGPFRRGGLVPGFSAVGHLGRKGTRKMDGMTALAVSAVGCLLADVGFDVTEQPDRVGVVLGTGAGSVQSIMEFATDSLTGEKPYHVDPARFPNTVMNRAAGQIAIWHGIKGPNATIAGDGLTGLLALNYALRRHRSGHCDQILCGTVEEYSTWRAWLEWRARDLPDEGTPLGEGAAVMLLESLDSARRSGRTPLATVLGTRFMAFGEPAAAAPTLARCVRAVLDQSGSSGDDVRVVVPLDPDGDLGRFEEDGIVDALGGTGQKWTHIRPLLGDTSAAATGFQLVAALAMLDADPAGLALVTGIDREGTVGCALLGARP